MREDTENYLALVGMYLLVIITGVLTLSLIGASTRDIINLAVFETSLCLIVAIIGLWVHRYLVRRNL